MNKKTVTVVLVTAVVVLMLDNRLRALPVVGKIPSL
jgi:hypothetical protein